MIARTKFLFPLYTLTFAISVLTAHVTQPSSAKRTGEPAILVTGGAGYIGSHTAFELVQRGRRVVILDNFINGQSWPHTWATVIRGDCGDRRVLDEIFQNYNIAAVMHFAAHIAVGESVTEPAKYYQNNVANTLTLLDAMRAYKIPAFIFSSTCAVFGNPEYVPVDEKHPKNPVSPYARSKLMIEWVLEDYAHAYPELSFITLRYFNVAGAHVSAGLGAPLTHVTDIILDSALKNKPFYVFGNDYPTRDGSGVRDYVHVRDIAAAHICALTLLETHLQAGRQCTQSFNVGSGAGFSVFELINAAMRITEKSIDVHLAPRRAGDIAWIIAGNDQATQMLGWKPQFSTLDHIFYDTLAWQKKQLEGHQS